MSSNTWDTNKKPRLNPRASGVTSKSLVRLLDTLETRNPPAIFVTLLQEFLSAECATDEDKRRNNAQTKFKPVFAYMDRWLLANLLPEDLAAAYKAARMYYCGSPSQKNWEAVPSKDLKKQYASIVTQITDHFYSNAQCPDGQDIAHLPRDLFMKPFYNYLSWNSGSICKPCLLAMQDVVFFYKEHYPRLPPQRRKWFVQIVCWSLYQERSHWYDDEQDEAKTQLDFEGLSLRRVGCPIDDLLHAAAVCLGVGLPAQAMKYLAPSTSDEMPSTDENGFILVVDLILQTLGHQLGGERVQDLQRNLDSHVQARLEYVKKLGVSGDTTKEHELTKQETWLVTHGTIPMLRSINPLILKNMSSKALGKMGLAECPTSEQACLDAIDAVSNAEFPVGSTLMKQCFHLFRSELKCPRLRAVAMYMVIEVDRAYQENA